MRAKLLFTVIFIFNVLNIFGQSTFQKNIGVSNNHLHDLNIEPMEDGSNDFIVAGNLFDASMQNEQLTIKRVAATGSVLWVNTYNHPSYHLVRGFDIVTHDGLIVATGSVDVNGLKKVFVITINANTGIIQNGMYYNIINTNFNSRGLHVIYTESDVDGDSNPDPGYLVGGFNSDCYALDPSCTNFGFLMRTDISLNLLWTTELDSNIADGFPNFDFINHVTETSNGFFITGSTTDPNLPSSPLQSVLALKIDFQGNLAWNQSYVFGNSKDVSVDAYYDSLTDIIYMLCNYSQAHYFGMTVLDNTTGSIGLSNSWVASSGSNYDVYGFTIMESLNSNDNLVVVGYDKEESWIDNDGTSQFGQNNPFIYEFNKNTGAAVMVNYQYLVPHMEPLGDEFNFWISQLPLIYYPEIAFAHPGTADDANYYLIGYRTEPPATFSEAELFKVTNDKINDCEQHEIFLNPVGVGLQDVSIIYGPTPNSATPFEPFNTVINFNSESCDPGLSVEDETLEKIILYPNPVNDILYFSRDNLIAFSIYDSLGKTIMEGTLIEKSSIEIASLKKGIYFIQLVEENELQVFKFIKN